MDQIMDIIKGRRSRREFLEKAVEEARINEIIEAGRYAPSSLNRQPWKFIVISDKAIIQKLSSIVKQKARRILDLVPLLKIFSASLRDPRVIAAVKKTLSGNRDAVFYNAPVLILIASERNTGPHVVKDCSFASQNMMLYAHSVGISSCFIGRVDMLMGSKKALALIGLPPHHIIQSAMVFGYAPGDAVSAPARKKDNIINWIR